LVRKGTVAFPLLVKHLDDHSYSYTSSGKPYWSVGDVCFRIITSQVEVFHEILGGDRRFQDAFLETPSQVKEWWQRNSKKTLREMQIEAARWELARQKNGNAREGRANQIAALERMIRTLSRANRPILVDRFGEIQEKTDATRSVEK
jgi:hypothetical protein